MRCPPLSLLTRLTGMRMRRRLARRLSICAEADAIRASLARFGIRVGSVGVRVKVNLGRSEVETEAEGVLKRNWCAAYNLEDLK